MNATDNRYGFTAWMTLHPWASFIYSWLFGMTAAGAGLSARPLYWVAAFVVLLAVFSIRVRSDVRLARYLASRAAQIHTFAITFLTIGALLASTTQTKAAEPPPVQPPQQAGAVGVAVVVVVVGGIITFGLVKLCKRLSPPPPPAPTNFTFQAQGDAGDNYAASYVYLTGSVCYSPSDLRAFAQQGSEPTPFATRLTARLVNEGSGPQMKILGIEQFRDEGSIINLEDYEAAIARHGIRLNVNSLNRTSYGRNGQPSTEEQVPISFSQLDHSATLGHGETVKVVIERSDNLTDWEQVVTTRLPIGQTIRIDDMTVTSQMFYRTRTL